MLKFASALKGVALQASDGEIGAIADFLVDDRTWAARWLVVDTGKWLKPAKVLLHPSALGKPDPGRLDLPVALTRAQVEGSPELSQHQPVSMQMERHLYDYYGWQPMSLESAFGAHPIASKYSAPPLFVFPPQEETATDCDPHLRSVDAITGYHAVGVDGAIGKVTDLLVDEDGLELPLSGRRRGKLVVRQACPDLAPCGQGYLLGGSRDSGRGQPRTGQGQSSLDGSGRCRRKFRKGPSRSLRLARPSLTGRLVEHRRRRLPPAAGCDAREFVASELERALPTLPRVASRMGLGRN